MSIYICFVARASLGALLLASVFIQYSQGHNRAVAAAIAVAAAQTHERANASHNAAPTQNHHPPPPPLLGCLFSLANTPAQPNTL